MIPIQNLKSQIESEDSSECIGESRPRHPVKVGSRQLATGNSKNSNHPMAEQSEIGNPKLVPDCDPRSKIESCRVIR
jgi:hypothetical protein